MRRNAQTIGPAITRPTRSRHVGPVLAAMLLGGCSSMTIVDKHGHQFTENDIRQVQRGMSQEQVKLSLGTPDTTSAIGGGAYYYISSTTPQMLFWSPSETDRRVLAVYFNPVGSVERVANYGLKDGKVFDFIKSETPTHARDESILKALFRNLGTGKMFGD